MVLDESKNTLKIIFDSQSFSNKKEKNRVEENISFSTQDGIDSLIVPISQPQTTPDSFQNLENIDDQLLNQKIEAVIKKIISARPYYRIELLNPGEADINFDNFVKILAENSSVSQNLHELTIENKNKKSLSPTIFNFVKNLPNITLFDCNAISVEQYLELSKKTNYVLSYDPSDEFAGLSEHINAMNQTDILPRYDGFSVSDCKYSTKLRINKSFDVADYEDELKKYFSLATNIETIEYDFSEISKPETDFVIDFSKLVRSQTKNTPQIIIFSEKDDQLFSKPELKGLLSTNNELSKDGVELGFSSNMFYINKGIKDIFLASNTVNKNIELIESLDVSNYEKYLLSYFFASDYEFRDDSKNTYKSRNSIDLINNKYGVCTAFTSLLETYLNRLNIKNIRDYITVSTSPGENREGHCRLIVHLGGDRENMGRVFIADPTAGATSLEFSNFNFAFAALPLDYKLRGVNEFSNLAIVQLAKVQNPQSRVGKILYENKSFVDEFYKELTMLSYKPVFVSAAKPIKRYYFQTQSSDFVLPNVLFQKNPEKVERSVLGKTILIADNIRKNSRISEDIHYEALKNIYNILTNNNLIEGSVSLEEYLTKNKIATQRYIENNNINNDERSI